MSFTSPIALLFGLTVPLVLGIYLLVLRRRRRQAVTYSSLALLRSVLPRRSRWRRHVPLGLLLVSLALLTVATARPRVTSDVPVGKTSVILAIDESASMCSTDMKPNRLGAAQKAARAFVDAQPSGVRMGLVLFSGFAELAVPPTTNRAALDKAIGNLSTGDGTAIGAAILQSLDAIAEVDPRVQPVGDAAADAAATPTAAGGSSAKAAKPGAHGYAPDIIVLLTDGSNTQGIEPLAAVPYAVARGVRIYTIGLGTTHPRALACTAAQSGGIGGFNFGFGGFGGGGGGGAIPHFGGFAGGRSPLVADLPMLRQVSRRTGGVSYTAQSASKLSKVFVKLPKDVTIQKERHEITDLFAALGALLALATILAAIRWSPYP